MAQHVIIGDGAVGHELASALGAEAICGRERCRRLSDNGELALEELHLEQRYLWVAVKYRDLGAVLTTVANGRPPKAITVCCNGIGVSHIYAQLMRPPRPPLVRCLIHYGVRRGDDGQVKRAGSRLVTIAGLDQAPDAVDSVEKFLLDAQFEVKREQSIALAEWKKIGINVVVNSLATLAQDRNRVVIESPELEQRAELLLAELRLIAQSEGFDLAELEYPAVRSSIEHHGDNLNSSLQDLNSGRRPEILDFLTSLQYLAEQYGIAIPEIKQVTVELQTLTREKFDLSDNP